MHCPMLVKNKEEWDKLGAGEKHLFFWQFGLHGGFYSALWDALKQADRTNLELLAQAYPYDVRALQRFRNEEGYWVSILIKLGMDRND